MPLPAADYPAGVQLALLPIGEQARCVFGEVLAMVPASGERWPAVPTISFMTLVIPDVLSESCATRQALERFASKWRVLVIYALLDGPQRHATLMRRLEGITQKVLTQTLREMEADAMVARRVVKQTAPMHVEYTLTPLGKTLQEPLAAICAWAQAAGGLDVGPDERRRAQAAPG